MDGHACLEKIRVWARELGFSQIAVADLASLDTRGAQQRLQAWLNLGYHGDMAYMAAHGTKRSDPAQLVPGTISVLTLRMDYLPATTGAHWREAEQARLQQTDQALISVYARGRDYHKIMRARLQTLSEKIATELLAVPSFVPTDAALAPDTALVPDAPLSPVTLASLTCRVFVDSAPVPEVWLAHESGLGWRGKHTLLLDREGGSMFFLGEIFLGMALPATPAQSAHCGSCNACMQVCPTQAIVAPYELDARRCISYLTIEHKGSIPLALRPALGNRIYGCDDCQTVCPWNKFAKRAVLADFDERRGMTGSTLLELFAWTEVEFLQRTQGSAIRRIGYERWQRNLAVALGNQLRNGPNTDATAGTRAAVVQALQEKRQTSTALVREHIEWALLAPCVTEP